GFGEVAAHQGDLAEVEAGAGGDVAVGEVGEHLAEESLGAVVVAEDVLLEAAEAAEGGGAAGMARVLLQERLVVAERAVVVGCGAPVAVGAEGALAGAL